MIGKPIILFQYHTSRGTKVLNSFLGGYKGTIVCDGLSTYDSFAAISDNIEIGACMAHIRRKFHHAHKALKKASPKQKPKTAEIMGIIGSIYKIEDEIKLLERSTFEHISESTNDSCWLCSFFPASTKSCQYLRRFPEGNGAERTTPPHQTTA